MASVFNVKINSIACGIGSRLVLVNYKYPVGSIVYICKSATCNGELVPVTITSIQFVKNTKLSYPESHSYSILYNGTYYEEQLCDEATVKALSIAYWESQEDLILRNLECNQGNPTV